MIDKKEVIKEAECLQDGTKEWVYNGRTYLVPIFGASAPEELLQLADELDGDKYSGTHKEIAMFFFDFAKTILQIKNTVDDDEIRLLANKKSISELYNLWMDADDSEKKN